MSAALLLQLAVAHDAAADDHLVRAVGYDHLASPNSTAGPERCGINRQSAESQGVMADQARAYARACRDGAAALQRAE